MRLFSVENGYVGQSVVRVYVWCNTVERALELAQEKFKANKPPYAKADYYNIEKFHLIQLFSGDDKEFCSLPSDDGFYL